MGNSYKEALERARQAIGNDAYTKEDALAYAFPELAESENERIRKALIHLISEQDGILTAINGISVKDILAWLEKQKEQKPAEKPSMLKMLKEHLANTPKEQLDAEFEALKYLTIDKPAEWSHEDEEHIKSLLARLEGMCKKEATFTQTRFAVSEDIDWLKSISERFVLQPKQEWGEENEKCIKDIIICLEYLQREDAVRKWNGDRNVKPERYDDMIAKLKSLRPQSKPEWNEEDERLLNIIIDILDREEHNGHLSHDDLKNCVKLIKSLRPQPHWKPSEEQMEALRVAYEIGTANESWAMSVLKSLYNDLKKLI